MCVCVFPSFHQNYLTSRGKSWTDLRQEALQSLEQGNYYLTGEPSHLLVLLSSWTVILIHTRSTYRVTILLKSDNLISFCACQIAVSLQIPSCASAAACEHSRSSPTSTDRTSLRLNCQVRWTKVIFIQPFNSIPALT